MTPWYRDPAKLRAEAERHGSLRAAAKANGVDQSTLSKWWGKLGLPPLKPNEPAKETLAGGGGDHAWLLESLKALRDDASVSDLADHADVSPRRVREALEALGQSHRLEESEGRIVLQRTAIPGDMHYVARPEMYEGDRFRFGVVSDTHLGSKADNPQAIHDAYKVFQDEGISDVLHVGDLVDGKGVYRGHIREVHKVTFDDQVDYAEEVYPHGDEYGGIRTKIIGGNHDVEGSFGQDGADPVMAFCHRRSDFDYLGPYSAWIDLPNGGRVHMLHPQGGASYALSYRPQKIVEGYDGGQKPNLVLIGHWHRSGVFTWRSVVTMLAGTFQGSTPFAVRKALGAPGTGFWIVEGRMADDGSLVRIRPTWMPFYAGRTMV